MPGMVAKRWLIGLLFVAASLGLRVNPRSRILSCFPPASGLSPEL
jgi:hypothetical protein